MAAADVSRPRDRDHALRDRRRGAGERDPGRRAGRRNRAPPASAKRRDPDRRGAGLLGELHRRFDARRQDLLAARVERQARFDARRASRFPRRDRAIRAGDWQVAPDPADLMDRRVEITGPTDRKMVINALNSGARCSWPTSRTRPSPTWANLIEGQANLIDHWRGTLAFTDPVSGKHYALGDRPAVLMVRPRGWHLDERHVGDARRRLFDFGLYLWHNAIGRSRPGRAPISICPSSKAITRPPCGATSSPMPRSGSSSRAARSRRRC